MEGSPPRSRAKPQTGGDAGARSESFRVLGGPTAPRAARLAVRSLLAARVAEREMNDVELVVSELVTNSVRHAHVGLDGSIGVDVLLLDDRVRLCVLDPGSSLLPRVVERDIRQAAGLGLPLVERLSSSWGVARDGSGATRVWSELMFSALEVP